MDKIVFISGLHRSGTSILHRTLAASDHITGFSNTGAPEDEGQHLQSVFKAAKEFGGHGKFAFDEQARLTEDSELITPENKEKLLNEWNRYWDEEKPIRIEKSPPNIIRTRFFQKLFPQSYFVTIIRHPVAVSLATQKRSKTTMDNLLEHWITAHEIYEKDRLHLENEIIFSYEYMIQSPEALIKDIETFLDTKIPYTEKIIDANQKYFKQWKGIRPWNWSDWKMKKQCIDKFEDTLNGFGYSLVDLEKYPDIRSTKS